MIFVTVGSQMPFDRMVMAMDEWAQANPAKQVFAQIGQSQLRPAHMKFCEALSPGEFRAHVASAEIIVAHAGMGSVLTALEYSKTLVLLPRRGDLRETRNDHQLATVRWLAQKRGIEVAMETVDLPEALNRALGAAPTVATVASPPADALVLFLSGYLDQVGRGD